MGELYPESHRRGSHRKSWEGLQEAIAVPSKNPQRGPKESCGRGLTESHKNEGAKPPRECAGWGWGGQAAIPTDGLAGVVTARQAL